MNSVTSVFPLREVPLNLGGATTTPGPFMHVGAEHGPRRSGVVARAKPSSMVVVLDLDECLVHSRAAVPRDGVSEDSFVFETDGANPQKVHTTLRPHLQEFLREVTSRYETYIYVYITQRLI